MTLRKTIIFITALLLSLPLITIRDVFAQDANASKPDLLGKLSENLTFSGLLEIEGSAARDFESRNTSDVKVATVSFGFDTQMDEYVSGHVLMLFEEDDTEPMEVDEATITLGGTETIPFFLTAGRMYLPFGIYDSSAISDPFTLTIAETRQSMLQIGAKHEGLYTSAYAFNCDSDRTSSEENDQIECFGGNAGITLGDDARGVQLEAGFMNSVTDTDTFDAYIQDSNFSLQEKTGAYALSARADLEPFKLVGEFISATEKIKFDELELDTPSAWNLEANYVTSILGKESVLVLGYHSSDNMVGLLPEARILGSLGVGITESLTCISDTKNQECK